MSNIVINAPKLGYTVTIVNSNLLNLATCNLGVRLCSHTMSATMGEGAFLTDLTTDYCLTMGGRGWKGGGGGGVWTTTFLADIICEQLLSNFVSFIAKKLVYDILVN